MKSTRLSWVPIIIAALPISALTFHFTPKAKRLWQVNVLPMAFVLSNTSYLNDCHVVLTFDDGTSATLDRPAIGQKVITQRFDKTVFSHFVRQGGTLSSQSPSTLLKNLFCHYSEENKKLLEFDFTILSPASETILQKKVACN